MIDFILFSFTVLHPEGDIDNRSAWKTKENHARVRVLQRDEIHFGYGSPEQKGWNKGGRMKINGYAVTLSPASHIAQLFIFTPISPRRMFLGSVGGRPPSVSPREEPECWRDDAISGPVVLWRRDGRHCSGKEHGIWPCGWRRCKTSTCHPAVSRSCDEVSHTM